MPGGRQGVETSILMKLEEREREKKNASLFIWGKEGQLK